MRKATLLLGRLVLLGALGAVSACSGAEEVCSLFNDGPFPSHGACVSALATLPIDFCSPAGPGFGQCVSGFEP